MGRNTGKGKLDYDEHDIEILFKRGQWKNWTGAIEWLRSKGPQDAELSPEEVISMEEDLVRTRDAAVPFTPNPHEAYRLVHHPH